MSGSRAGFPASPLAPSFERMAEMKDELYLFARLGIPPDDEGWLPMSRLTEDGDFVREQLRSMKEKWDLDNRGAAIGVVGGLAWQVGGAALFVYATERRVPDLSPENVMLRLADGGPSEVAFVSGRFAALSGDTEAGSATAVFDEDGLRSHLRERLEGMLSPVVDNVRAAMRVSKRTMWNRASDLIGQRLLQFGESVADKSWCGHEAERLVKSSGSPLDGATRFFVVEHGGREEVRIVRGCCCQAYKNPEHGYCGTCPLLSQEELERLAVEAMSG